VGKGTDVAARRERRGRAGRRDEAEARLGSLRDEQVPPEVRTRHLARIRSHEPTPVPAPARRPAPRTRRLVPLTAATAALLLFGGSVVAAQEAAPDDALYGVKRASESVWLALPRDADRSAEVHLALAERRLGEARRAPEHAPRLIDEGVAEAEAAADDRPEEAVEALGRLLGEGADALPAQASPRARQALHRNCTRIAARHGLSDAPCGTAPEAGDHPGRGPRGEDGPGLGREGAPGQLGPGGGERSDGHPGRGWGPGGRPDGAVGPPPGVPADRTGAPDDEG
jgi:hypothetical protein